MIAFAAVLVCLVLGALAVFQGFLVFGAPLGRFAWGGQHRVLPVSLRAGSVVSIVIYGVLATVVLARADLVSPGISDEVLRTATWVIVAYFFVGIGLNLVSRSKQERAVMTPVVAVLCALCAVVALS
jgi:predicted permease